VDPAETFIAISDRIPAIDPAEFPSGSGSAQIQIAVFAKASSETEPKNPDHDLIRAVIDIKKRNSR